MTEFRERTLEYTLSRRDALDQQIAALALTSAYAPAVEVLQCFRGIQVHSAIVLATELVDWRRFDAPRKLMAYVGFVPREHSSGPRERRGSITKAGNTHCRHVLVQAAWAYRLHPKIGPSLAVRQRGQSPAVTMHAWKAQQRLSAMYHRLALRRGPQIAVVAVARELIGYLWAVMRNLEIARETSSPVVTYPPHACCTTAPRTSHFARRHTRHVVVRRSTGVRWYDRSCLGFVMGSVGRHDDPIPDPRMSALQTNPILAAPPWRHGDRRISAGFIVGNTIGTRGRSPHFTTHQHPHMAT